MQADKNTQNFQVALLIEDIAQAREVSDTLREMGIYAHYYNDLDEFWVAANTETPDFAIVDVKKMSQGSLLFKNHPKVQNKALSYAFFYSDSTKILVNSTFSLNHYGLIQRELSLLGQLRSVLKRRNEELRLIDENKKMQERVARLQTRSNRILQDAQETLSFKNQFHTLVEVTSRLGTARSREDYLGQLASLLSEWEDCLGYGLYTLNQTNQKLTSPKMIKPGYEQLPDLWLTKPAEKGIEVYAQEMACEVAFDLFDNEARAVNIFGARENPDVMVVARFNEKALNDFSWDLFEERLSHSYAKLLLKELSTDEPRSNRASVWEAFSYLDDVHFHQTQGRHKLADVDFSRMIQTIKEKSGNRFYWKSFHADFVNQLEETLSGDFKISTYGVQSFLVFIDKAFLESDYQKLKAVVEDFQYWRYFQNTSMVMSVSMAPEVRLVAPSSLNTIRQVYSNIISAGQSKLENKPTSFRGNALDA